METRVGILVLNKMNFFRMASAENDHKTNLQHRGSPCLSGKDEVAGTRRA